jgi:NAD(P)-dependent dehydrogenase (short-subunit alcohol dehydrogenase family)
MTDFSGRTALITGAASGIGAACAQWLGAQGAAELILVDLDSAALAALDLPCAVRRYAGDVADETLWNRIEGDLTRLDHAVINAGIADGCPIVSQDFAQWRRMLSVNLDGAFLALRASLRVMGKSEGPRSVVMTSSVAGTKPMAMTAAYGSSKAAVAHLARIAGAECAAQGIRVNAIAPGKIETPIWTKTSHFTALVAQLGSREAAEQALRTEAASEGQGKLVSADQLAAQIGFLLSDAADNITGTVVVSDGGYSL